MYSARISRASTVRSLGQRAALGVAPGLARRLKSDAIIRGSQRRCAVEATRFRRRVPIAVAQGSGSEAKQACGQRGGASGHASAVRMSKTNLGRRDEVSEKDWNSVTETCGVNRSARREEGGDA